MLKPNLPKISFIALLSLCINVVAIAQTTPESIKIDFSYAGYKGGAAATNLVVPTLLIIKPTGYDDTRLLQAAINKLARYPMQKNGFRGTLLLSAGNYKVDGQLHITTSGVVIKGSKGTVITATGTSRRALIEIGRSEDPVVTTSIQITDDAPTGNMRFKVADAKALKVGQSIAIKRPSTKAWIAALGMDTIKGVFADLRGLQWREGTRDLIWNRTITYVDHQSNLITIDAPITQALQAKYGGGSIARHKQTPFSNIILEGVTLVSQYGNINPKDEEHAWIGVSANNTEDVYIKSVTARHFVGSAFMVAQLGRRVTIDGCAALEPISETGGYRRRNFYVEGQQVLVKNCSSENGMADFATGLCAAGPNVFLNCTTTNSLGASGALESWSAGTLFENVTISGADLFLGYDMQRVQAAGWTAANSIVWNCKANKLIIKGHPLTPNTVVNSGQSLYQSQLTTRGISAAYTFTTPTQHAVPFTAKDIPALKATAVAHRPIALVNGRFVSNNKIIWGGEVNESWWLGHVIPSIALDAGVSITRYVPGKSGRGLTEQLPDMIRKMTTDGMTFYQGGPGLWYDRRRDEHSVTERMDGNVWAAFYEFPWARSGQGKAWDGLSKFDLTRYNPWYFNRIKDFLKLVDQNGFVYYHSLYNTHNVLEIGAHWADYPWRPANNINDTGLPEPPPLEGNNRLHLANQFYSTAYAGLKKLHEAYINHVLDELGGYQNIVFNLGYQFAGPLEFQKFFLRTVAAWEKRNHKQVRLEIGTSKDITDSILNNPEFSPMIDVVDMRYWQYKPNGSIWAPQGGQNLAFRELNAKLLGKGVDTPPATTPQMAYKQVREYRDKFPAKTFIAWHNCVGQIPALMAGAAQVYLQNPAAGQSQGRVKDSTPFDGFVNRYLSETLARMSPRDGLLKDADNNWCLATKDFSTLLIYSLEGDTINLARTLPSRLYKAVWYNAEKDQVIKANLSTASTINKPNSGQWLLYLTKY
ncbi:DUF6298 domain-containing protein [Mucilaginibacter sp. PAMB04274]|uniref:DUF6298 domain-containing protein n=1 Tax=Mucilaginibacter sp. PAMB04274 TaxID=3138568 RepID=UPI0031F65D92